MNEKVGDVVKVKEENIIKIIDKVGTCSDKPIEIDDVVLKSYCYYIEQGTQKEIKVPYLCEFADETEVNLSDEKIEEWQFKRNLLPNLQFLERSKNESKNNTPLKDWIQSGNKIEYMPSNVSLELKDFDKFFEERRKLLKNELKNVFGI